jgi:hypothetical protein
MIRQRRWWLGGLVVLLCGVALLGIVPGNPERQGSTYGRTPDGYGAWYTALRQDCVDIRRWQRPVRDLPGYSDSGTETVSPIVLLHVNGMPSSRSAPIPWLRQGNVEVALGVLQPVTAAPFRSRVETPVGPIQVDTRRRAALPALDSPDYPSAAHPQTVPATLTATDDAPEGSITWRVTDAYGGLVWDAAVGQGRLISVLPPFLAANAYQNTAHNFDYLTQLVTEPGLPIVVDEFIHGHRTGPALVVDDVNEACPPLPELAGFTVADEAVDEAEPSLWGYLARTPLLIVVTQAIALALLVMWAQNRRFGPPLPIPDPKPDNSRAYITALAQVLAKAGCQDFVVTMLRQAEQQRLQRYLGLGTQLLDPDAIAQTWQAQTQRPAQDILDLLRPPSPMGQQDLLRWLSTIQRIRRQLDVPMPDAEPPLTE